VYDKGPHIFQKFRSHHKILACRGIRTEYPQILGATTGKCIRQGYLAPGINAATMYGLQNVNKNCSNIAFRLGDAATLFYIFTDLCNHFTVATVLVKRATNPCSALWFRFPAEERDFTRLAIRSDRLWGPPRVTLCWYRRLFPGGKTALS
jgi:hypothetical protein